LSIAVAAVAVVLIFESDDSPVTGGAGYGVSVVFPSAKGLVKKSQVLVSGIPVGEIETITLDGDNARIYLRVRKELKLYKNATAKKIQESLLGTSLIEITPGTPDAGLLKDGEQIQNSKDSVQMEELMNKFGDISHDVKAITASLKSSLAGVAPDGKANTLDEIMKNVLELTKNINEIVADNKDAVNSLVINADNAAIKANGLAQTVQTDLKDALGNLKTITDEIKVSLMDEKSVLKTSGPAVDRISKRLDGIMDKLDKVIDNVEVITGNIKDGKGTVGKLLNDEKVANDVAYIVDTAKKAVEKADKLQLQFHLESNYYPMENAAKTYVYLNIKPNKNKAYIIGAVSDPWGKITRTKTATSNKVYDAQGKLVGQSGEEVFETQTEYSFKFTLLYYRTLEVTWWFWPSAYFGIIENTGGVGLDLHFFDDFWRINTQFYDFALDQNPNWKAQTSLTFLEHRLFITAGIDQILNDKMRAWFVGGGLEFNDDDLKLLLTTGGASMIPTK